jgi:hypothetical protein
MFPGCGSSAEMKSDEYKQRYAAGPWGSIRVLGQRPNFGRNLMLVFLVYVIVGIFVAYITDRAMAGHVNPSYLEVFRFAGTVAVASYVLGALPGAIFMAKPLRFTITDTIDGVVYGLLTAGVFGWLWPESAIPGV